VFSASEGVAECDIVAPKGYIKFVDITLVVELLVSFTRDLLIILKAEYSKLILPFKIGFIVTVHVVLSISNKDANITQKSLY